MSSRQSDKYYIVDTSALIHDASGALNELSRDGNTVVVPYAVIEELDGLRKAPNGRGALAREASRIIDAYREKGLANKRKNWLRNGVPTDTGGTLYVDHEEDWGLLPSSLERNNDGRILLVAKKWANKYGDKGIPVIIVSRDIILRIKADAFGLLAENTRFDSSKDEEYSGRTRLELTAETAAVFTKIYSKESDGFITDEDCAVDGSGFLANQCVDLCFGDRHCLTIRTPNGFRLVRKPNHGDGGRGIQPVNEEQALAKALLDDPSLFLVTLSGKAGTGKTLISLLSAVEQIHRNSGGGRTHLQIYRPNIEIGAGMGFLPGDLDQKFEPWTKPIFDNLNLIEESLGATDLIQTLLDDRKLEISPISFIRGRSLNNAVVLVDEAQNLTPHEVKTIITRAGANTKFILTGDPDQIDNSYVDKKTNGLTYVIERFKGASLFGHITLTKGERSPLAELAATLLQ